MNELSVHSTSGFLPWIELGEFRIQSYFVIISFVLSLCAFWIPKRAVKFGLDPRRALDIFIFAMIGGFLGSRIMHILWEEPKYYFDDPLRVFDVMSGGFVWYGGALGAIISIVIVLRLKREKKIGAWLDFSAPVAAFGYAGGRAACVLTGCCYGRVCEWSSVAFRFPTQGFAVLWELAVGIFLLWLEKQKVKRFVDGTLFSAWLILHGVGRLVMESLRADPRGPALGLVTISFVLSLIIVLVGSFFLIRRRPY